MVLLTQIFLKSTLKVIDKTARETRDVYINVCQFTFLISSSLKDNNIPIKIKISTTKISTTA